MEFKVGDKVRHAEYGKGKVVDIDTHSPEDGRYLILYKNPPGGYGFKHIWANEEDLTLRQPKPKPAIPDGWTPASEPPDTDHGISKDVEVLLKGGSKAAAWYGTIFKWNVYLGEVGCGPDTTNDQRVIAWRELEPAKPARSWSLSVGTPVRIVKKCHGGHAVGKTGEVVELLDTYVVEEVYAVKCGDVTYQQTRDELEVIDQSARIPVGAKVIIRGVVTYDDNDAVPYRVETPAGTAHFFKTADLELDA